MKALIVLDAQVNMFDEAAPVYKSHQLLRDLQRLIERARAAGVLVVYIRNNGGPGDPDQPGTPGWQIHPALSPQIGDLVYDKYTADSFHDTDLHASLQARGVRHLYIAGMQTEVCIRATVQRAAGLGYEVTLASDLHSTFDMDEMSAEEAITAYNRQMNEVAEVVPGDAIDFS